MSLSCTLDRPAIVNSAVHSLSFGFAYVFLLTWLCASWLAGTPQLRHVREDRPVYMSRGALLLENLTLVLLALLASPSRLPFSIVLRESRFFVCTFVCTSALSVLLLHDGQLRRFPPSLGHGFPCSLHCTSSTSVSSIILSESSSASFSLIVTCSATMFVGRPVFWTVWCVRHFALWAVVVGHPRLPRLPAPPVYRGCPCRGPTGVPSDAQSGWHREQSANPCVCAVLVVVDMCCGHRAYTRSSSTPPRLVKSCC